MVLVATPAYSCWDRGPQTLAMATIMYSMVLNILWLKEKRIVKPNSTLGRHRLRGDIQRLTARYKETSENEISALAELRKYLREQIASLRRAENNRKNRKETSRKRANFTTDLFQFTKKLIGDNISGKLDCPKQDVEDHLNNVRSDKNRDRDLGDPTTLMVPEPLHTNFDSSESKLQEVPRYHLQGDVRISTRTEWHTIQSL